MGRAGGAQTPNRRGGWRPSAPRTWVAFSPRLQLTDLSGIAEATARRLRTAGIHTPLDFLRATAPRLRSAGMHAEVAGGWGKRLRGFEVAALEHAARKSYSHSHVLGRATTSQHDLEELLMLLSEMVGRRLRAGGRRGRVVSIGVVYRPDEGGHFSRQATLPHPIATGDEIYRAALNPLDGRDHRRLVGTPGGGLSGLTDDGMGQLEMFDGGAPPRHERLEAAVDAIRDRFGEDAMQKSRLLGRAPAG